MGNIPSHNYSSWIQQINQDQPIYVEEGRYYTAPEGPQLKEFKFKHIHKLDFNEVIQKTEEFFTASKNKGNLDFNKPVIEALAKKKEKHINKVEHKFASKLILLGERFHNLFNKKGFITHAEYSDKVSNKITAETLRQEIDKVFNDTSITTIKKWFFESETGSEDHRLKLIKAGLDERIANIDNIRNFIKDCSLSDKEKNLFNAEVTFLLDYTNKLKNVISTRIQLCERSKLNEANTDLYQIIDTAFTKHLTKVTSDPTNEAPDIVSNKDFDQIKKKYHDLKQLCNDIAQSYEKYRKLIT